MRLASLFFLALISSAHAADEMPSGLPVPRFVSLKSDETNLRTGPGTRYPILWVYRRAHLPVEVVDEFDTWRKIRDREGAVGWVHHTMLSGKRYAIVLGMEPQTMRIDHKDDARPLYKVEPGLVAAIDECEELWCRLQVEGRKAWIRKENMWGAYESEQFD